MYKERPDFKGMGRVVEKEILAIRRHLHQCPELSGEEWETSAFIEKKLQEYGIPYTKGYAGTGILGVIDGGRSGATVALRADIDALPIEEKVESAYQSKYKGKMHACGHDAHTAMLLGAGKLLMERKGQIAGRVLLVFQPSEEDSPIGGAQPVMDDGIFDQYRPDVIFGQHVWPDLPSGTVGVRDGVMMGASDRFRVTFYGMGGHASMPHQTTDAVTIAMTVINQLQTIVSRNVDPLSAAVLTVGKIEGGYRYNVIADQVTVEGTVRTLDEENRNLMKERFHQIVRDGTHAMGGKAKIDYIQGYPPTVNHTRWAQRVRKTARAMFGDASVPQVNPSLGGEDFSRYLKQYPGAFFWLGFGPKGGCPSHCMIPILTWMRMHWPLERS